MTIALTQDEDDIDPFADLEEDKQALESNKIVIEEDTD